METVTSVTSSLLKTSSIKLAKEWAPSYREVHSFIASSQKHFLHYMFISQFALIALLCVLRALPSVLLCISQLQRPRTERFPNSVQPSQARPASIKKIDHFYSAVAFIMIRETNGTQKFHVMHGSISHVDARPLMAWVFERRLLLVREVYRK